MSTLTISFNTQALDFSPLNRGKVDIVVNIGGSDITLTERLTQSVSSTRYFQEVAWVSGQETTLDNQQAQNFATSFNRDYKDIGGVKNLGAIVSGDTVTITLKTGTFESVNYDGNVLVVGDLTIVNSDQSIILALNVNASNVGNCNTIDYSATLSGGESPYVIKNGTSTINSNWDGNLLNIQLNRGTLNTINATDSDGNSKSITINVPRKLAIGEFKESSVQYDGYSDVLITNVNPVSGTTPITYALESLGSTSGLSYQESNAFSGIIPNSYELFVKDKFGCVVTKTITINDLNVSNEDSFIKYFDISEGNSILFAPYSSFDADNKKNFKNTSSRNELTGIRYNAKHRFVATDNNIGTQFKSSYPYHIITLHRCNGTKKDIPFIAISKNIGSKERVDVKFAKIDGKNTFYFDGGNEYEPNTTTIIGASEYVSYSPDWAKTGQLVFFDSLGGFEILEEGYSQDLGKGYFVTDLNTTLTDGIAQATFNKHDYDTYEFYLNMSDVTDKGVIVIEYGYSFTEVEPIPWVSETIERIEDSDDDILIKWSNYKNIDPIVFQSGIEMMARIRGVFRPIFKGESETTDGDSKVYSIDQTLYQNYRLEIDYLTAKQVYQLCIATGVELEVNNVILTRLSFPEIEQLGQSNYFTFKVDLGYSGNILGVVEDEYVLNVSTGVIGGGTAKTVSNDDRFRLNLDSGFVTVGGDFIAV